MTVRPRVSSTLNLASAQAALAGIETLETYGRVVAIKGLLVEVAGPVGAMRLGGRLDIMVENATGAVPCEIIGFQGDRALAMPFGSLEGVRRGCPAMVRDEAAGAIRPSAGWLGRTIDALGRPVDGLGPLPPGPAIYPLRADPPPAHARRRVGPPLDLGIRCINTFITMCAGQRMGIFAGSGVGKSVLLSMLARYTAADVAVIGLVGERGREVQEFLQDDLGPAGLARSVVVVATSDEPALMRRNAAYVTLAIAEYFRDQGAQVLCMIDSITRFAMAQRDIGLAAGEPPTAKGYTPTVFSELPRLLERAGPGTGQGAISGLFTVLVEGDDHNEPVADAVRGILDGHIVMERGIAERGRYPAINVLRSVSRTMPRSCDPVHLPTVRRARRILSTYADMEELIRLGAYRAGASAEVDEAVALMPSIEAFLGQSKEEATSIGEGYQRLAAIVGSA
ncbi:MULTISPECIES: flagellar protein export ATPase FliI [Methylobacterium]|uniref:Flagellum-specific ATP synthase n=1 Tax=Methylobacterium bullatum TaxID=570505 RepID=A0AAV4Z5R3_9HYPH|nr:MULTISPECIES: flagellar protein export ATPase FliI [Methylobacterium]MBD8902605.1 flagellum-specific ATP synthase FliI [Methylobacterium bullatum]TXN33949.1 flagellar protein export ATPase FliI [Methylobacterium sp. WL19]GJD39266.1 putative ATP synthase YscN [Methylobacterium bullatum]